MGLSPAHVTGRSLVRVQAGELILIFFFYRYFVGSVVAAVSSRGSNRSNIAVELVVVRMYEDVGEPHYISGYCTATLYGGRVWCTDTLPFSLSSALALPITERSSGTLTITLGY